jgi:SAM-dependent methyltransferase
LRDVSRNATTVADFGVQRSSRKSEFGRQSCIGRETREFIGQISLCGIQLVDRDGIWSPRGQNSVCWTGGILFELELQPEDVVQWATAAPIPILILLQKVVWFRDQTYSRLYEQICGKHPHRRPWHYRWLSVKDMYRDLARLLPTLQGEVLDVGCLGKPYAVWLRGADSHVGIDVTPGPTVDYVIQEGKPWPLESGRFESAICTQVMQVVEDPSHLVDELHRVLAPGGVAIVTLPFSYHDMSLPRPDGDVYRDYWRHSLYGAETLLSTRFEVVEIIRQGGIGSTLGAMALGWIRMSAARRPSSNIIFAAMLPLWVPFCLGVNLVGYVFDRLDATNAFYHNVLIVLRKAH